MELLSNPITSQVISICVAGICGFLAAQVRRITDREKALYEGMKTILRKELIDAYETYVIGSTPLSVTRRDELDRCYRAYKDLGGNGTGEHLYQKIMQVQVYTIIEKED